MMKQRFRVFEAFGAAELQHKLKLWADAMDELTLSKSVIHETQFSTVQTSGGITGAAGPVVFSALIRYEVKE